MNQNQAVASSTHLMFPPVILMFPSVILMTKEKHLEGVRYTRLEPPYSSLPLHSLQSPQRYQIVLCTSVSLFQSAVVLMLNSAQRLNPVGVVLVVVVVLRLVVPVVVVVPRLASVVRGGASNSLTGAKTWLRVPH